LFLLALIMASGCGPGRAAEPTPAEPVELRYVTFNALGSVEQALVDQFVAANPYIEVEVQSYRQAPLQYLTAAGPPDLMLIVPGEQFITATDQGLLTDLTDLWQEAGLDRTYPAAFRALSEQDGKQFLFPIGYTWNGVYYNRGVFEQYGLQPPQSWDEFITLCDTLLINGETPLAMSGRDFFMASLWIDYLALRLYGVDFQRRLTRGEIPYSDDRVRTVFETWRSLIERGYFLEDAQNQTGLAAAMTVVRDERLDLARGRAVMILAGPATLSELPDAFRAELDFFAFPTIDPTLPTGEVVYTAGYMIPAAAPHRLEALRFLTFLSTQSARDLVNNDLRTTGLFVPAFAQHDGGDLPATVQQGMSQVQEADAVVSALALSVPQPVQLAFNEALRRLLANPRTGQSFDLEDVLTKLETARLRDQ
jgi:ABC-type glycerol-3-phosphate transport system substrate-binding protein